MVNVPKRLCVDLDVFEVSLVDSPANEKNFAILKRVEDNEMPDDVKEVIENEATSGDKKPEGEIVEEKKTEENVVEKEKTKEVSEEVAAVDPGKIADEAVEKALDKVTELIDSIAKKANEKNVSEPVKKEEEPAKEKAEEPTAKAEEKVEEKAEEKVEEKVEKEKRFTPRRIQALTEATQKLQDLVGEIAANIQPKPEEVSKAKDDELKEVLKSLSATMTGVKAAFEKSTEATKTLTERVDAIEKTRQPSKSVNDDGGTDSEVKKTNNIWKGLL